MVFASTIVLLGTQSPLIVVCESPATISSGSALIKGTTGLWIIREVSFIVVLACIIPLAGIVGPVKCPILVTLCVRLCAPVSIHVLFTVTISCTGASIKLFTFAVKGIFFVIVSAPVVLGIRAFTSAWSLRCISLRVAQDRGIELRGFIRLVSTSKSDFDCKLVIIKNSISLSDECESVGVIAIIILTHVFNLDEIPCVLVIFFLCINDLKTVLAFSFTIISLWC